MSVVVLDYHDLVNDCDLKDQIKLAYGFDGLGVLTVKNVPGLEAMRERLLTLAHRLGNLDNETKQKYSHPSSNYSFGWSHGVENLEGKADVAKGSFYANPQIDRPSEDEELISRFSSFLHPNIWPTEDLPDLEQAFKDLGQLIVSVGLLIGKQCDRYIKDLSPTYETSRLERIISTSRCCKGRLLHYFAMDSEQIDATNSPDNFSSWCGWHNDHSSLTGLVSAQFMDRDGRIVENGDPHAGIVG